LYVEGHRAASVTHDVALALGSRVNATHSRSLESAVKTALKGDSLSHALAARDRARKVADAARTSLGESGADVAIAIAVAEPDSAGAHRRVDVLLVPRQKSSPALLQEADMPELATAKARMAWWVKTFRSPERPPTPLDDTSDEAPAPPPADAGANEAARESGDLSSPYAAVLAAGQAGAQKTPPPSRPPSTSSSAAGHPAQPPRRPRRYFVRAAFELSLRHFEDVETGPGAPRTYDAFPIPGVLVSVEAYPLFGGVLGLEGAFGQSFGVRSTTSERTTVSSSWTRAEAALKGRLVFGKTEEAPSLSVLAGYGYSSFTFESAPTGRETPAQNYHLLRYGVDTSIPVHRFVFSGGAEYDHLISIGTLAVDRAKAPGHGFTARLGIGFHINPWLSARLDGRFAWFTYDLVRSVQAHAVDEYLGGAIGLEASF
jgi:hypothetical protein